MSPSISASLFFNTRGTVFTTVFFFKNYIISEINDENLEPSDLRFKCPACDGHLKKTCKWKFKNRYFAAEFLCKNCEKNIAAGFRPKSFTTACRSKNMTEIKPKPKEQNK